MQRAYVFSGFVICAAAATLVAWQLTRGDAQTGDATPNGKPATPLPITQVILFNSGVGYLQREGELTGDVRVELSFPTSDINDLLKSLVLSDGGGGKVGAISYDSQDPVDKILRSFALDLNNNPSFGQILNQARGEKIDVSRQEKPGANPHKLSGTIIGMEVQRQPIGKDAFVDTEVLNLLTADGMQALPLAQVLSVRFQNPQLQNEFQRALQVLAGAHDVQKKTVALQFNGKGKRPVKVGYVLERPIWKTTYRLVLEPNGRLHIQGWAIVENVSDDDWNNVRMVLVSGKPISYRMDLYEPLYIPRPLVEPELFASLRPPVYGGSLEREREIKDLHKAQEPPPLPEPKAKNGVGGGGFGGFGKKGGKGGVPAPPPVLIPAPAKPAPLTYDDYLERKKKDKAADEAKKIGGEIAGLNYKEGVQSFASAEDVGDYYQYVIDQKISLARQKSAMLPILNQTIEGNKVSIFSASVHSKYPLLGIRLKNTSGKPLTQGPITVYDDGSYAGDTRVLDLQPNEERLLSYALDQATEVKTEVKTHPGPEMHFKIGGNNLTAGYTMRQTTAYTLKNRGTHDRTVLIEHAIRSDWKLVDPAKPADRTRDVYRFSVAVPAGATVKQEVVEDQQRTDPVALFSPTGDVLPFYAVIEGIDVTQAVKGRPPELLSLAVLDGVVAAQYKQRESKTYFIQNQSAHDHAFTIDHLIRKEWKRLGADGKDQVGPDVYRFSLAVPSKKTAHQEVVEERVHSDHDMVLAKVSEDTLRIWIAHAAPSAKVKAAMQIVLDKAAKLKATKLELAEKKDEMKVLTEDQVRVRENLKIVPPASDQYKDFLKKFVAQEAQIEDLQRAIRTTETQVTKLQKEYDDYVTTLTVK